MCQNYRFRDTVDAVTATGVAVTCSPLTYNLQDRSQPFEIRLKCTASTGGGANTASPAVYTRARDRENRCGSKGDRQALYTELKAEVLMAETNTYARKLSTMKAGTDCVVVDTRHGTSEC